MGGGPYYAVLGGSRILNASMVDQSGSDDNPVTGWTKTDEFIVAVCIHSGGKDTEAAQYKLQFQDDDDGGGYADLAATGELNYSCTITNLDQGDPVATGDQVCDVQGGDTRQAGEEIENASLSDSIDLPDEYQTELWFGINSDGADDGHTYSFHLYDVTNGRDLGLLGVTITIAAAGQTFYENVGQGATAIVGVLKKKTSKKAGAHAMTITGVLTSQLYMVEFVGQGATAIAGALAKKTSIFMGKFAVSPTGVLKKKTSKDTGGHSMTITGILDTAIFFTQTAGGAAMSIIGTLGTNFIQGFVYRFTKKVLKKVLSNVLREVFK